MTKKVKFSFLIFFVYLASYCVFAFDGDYRPIAFGAHERNGVITMESKKLGRIWHPDFPNGYSNFMEGLYSPLIYLDRFLVHRKKSE